jgi:GT2 family glycosyltransferase
MSVYQPQRSTPISLDASVIIPTHNRRDALLETLAALARIDYPPGRWEAVVVDDGSSDDTEESFRGWAEVHPSVPVRYLRQCNAGPASARNRGAAAARGSILIFIDNDILVEHDFISMHVEALSSNPGCWVLGRVVHPPGLRATPLGRYRDDLFESFAAGHPNDRLSETAGLSAQNLSMPADDLRRLGGYDEGFSIASSEDWELGWRARRAAIRVMYHPGIIVVHNDWAVTLERLCERQRLYSISDALLWVKYGDVCFRARLVSENAPIAWGRDPAQLVVKKAVKSALSSRLGRWSVLVGCGLAERLAPDTRWSRRFYDAAVAIAIFRGVREGLRRYGTRAVNAEAPVPTGS